MAFPRPQGFVGSRERRASLEVVCSAPVRPAAACAVARTAFEALPTKTRTGLSVFARKAIAPSLPRRFRPTNAVASTSEFKGSTSTRSVFDGLGAGQLSIISSCYSNHEPLTLFLPNSGAQKRPRPTRQEAAFYTQLSWLNGAPARGRHSRTCFGLRGLCLRGGPWGFCQPAYRVPAGITLRARCPVVGAFPRGRAPGD